MHDTDLIIIHNPGMRPGPESSDRSNLQRQLSCPSKDVKTYAAPNSQLDVLKFLCWTGNRILRCLTARTGFKPETYVIVNRYDVMFAIQGHEYCGVLHRTDQELVTERELLILELKKKK